MEELIAAFKETELSVVTQKKYVRMLLIWMKMMKTESIIELVSNPAAAMEVFAASELKQTNHNLHQYISSALAYVNHILKDKDMTMEWKVLQKENYKSIQERYDENRPSELQQTKIMTLKEIDDVRKSLPKGSFERLLLSFYTLIEPLRADYHATALVYVGEESKEENYIWNDCRLIVRDFKTAKKYGMIDNNLSEELQEELKASLEKYPRKYLFTKDDKVSRFQDKKMFSNWACKALKRVLKHPMDLTVLRHIYIIEMMKEKTGKEMIEIAKKMGHSRDTQRVSEWV